MRLRACRACVIVCRVRGCIHESLCMCRKCGCSCGRVCVRVGLYAQVCGCGCGWVGGYACMRDCEIYPPSPSSSSSSLLSQKHRQPSQKLNKAARNAVPVAIHRTIIPLPISIGCNNETIRPSMEHVEVRMLTKNEKCASYLVCHNGYLTTWHVHSSSVDAEGMG